MLNIVLLVSLILYQFVLFSFCCLFLCSFLLLAVIFFIVAFIFFIVAFCYFLKPLKPTDAKPDMSKMRIVSESELKWGDNVLGSGAFGTVFKVISLPWYFCLWLTKVPVSLSLHFPQSLLYLHFEGDSSPGFSLYVFCNAEKFLHELILGSMDLFWLFNCRNICKLVHNYPPGST